MSGPVLHIDIGRIVLSGIPLTAPQAADLQAHLEVALARRLASHQWTDGTGGRIAIPHLTAPAIARTQSRDTRALAESLAQTIAQALAPGAAAETGGTRGRHG